MNLEGTRSYIPMAVLARCEGTLRMMKSCAPLEDLEWTLATGPGQERRTLPSRSRVSRSPTLRRNDHDGLHLLLGSRAVRVRHLH